MLLFGVEDWSEQGDAFGVYFSLFSRLSALVRDEQGNLCARRPLSGLPDLPIRRGTVALICTMIGTTTFDGFSNGGIWRNNEPSLEGLFADLGLHLVPAQELAYSLGLVLCILLIAGVYRLGHPRRAQRQRPLRHPEADDSLRAHARADRLRLRARALLLAAAVAGSGARLT